MDAGTKNMSISEVEQEIVDEFSLFDDWMEKYEHLIEMGKRLPAIEDEYKNEEHRVRGCQSNVWLRAYQENGRVYYKADSDAIITKGMIALLLRVLSGQPPQDIENAELKFIDEIGMKEHLSSQRSNGLEAMIRHIRQYAKNFKS